MILRNTLSDRAKRQRAANETAKGRAKNLLRQAKYRAATKGLAFDLDLEWMLAELRSGCTATGKRFDLSTNGNTKYYRSPYSPSLDRIDATKGYTKDNCRLIIWAYNNALSYYDEETLFDIAVSLLYKKHAA